MSSSTPLKLYLNLRRLHRKQLPAHLRRLGDRYMRTEWDLHRTATPEQANLFLQKWTEYKDHLNKQQSKLGIDLTQEQRERMNEAQRKQLEELRREALNFDDEEIHYRKES